MADERGPIDLAADFLVYAPVGFAIAAKELLPDLAERGRAYVDGQVAVARVVGQVAVKQGQSEAGKVFSQVRDQVGGALEQLLRSWASGGEPVVQEPAPTTATSAPVVVAPPPTSGPGAATLAIPEYDSLAASQVLPRLQGLTPEELEAVRDYEASHRGRRTILGKIDQLQRPV